MVGFLVLRCISISLIHVGEVQSRFRACSEQVQSMFGVCFISSSSASSVSVLAFFEGGLKVSRVVSWFLFVFNGFSWFMAPMVF